MPAGIFQPRRVPDQSARTKHLEDFLERLSADVVTLAQPRAAARNTGGAALAAAGGTNGGGGGGGTGVLFGDVTGPETNTLVVGIEGVPLSGAPAGGDDHRFLRFDSGVNQFVYSGAVMTAPDATDRNRVVPTDDSFVALDLQWHSATHAAPLLRCLQDDGATVLAQIDVGGQGSFTKVNLNPTSAGAQMLVGSAVPNTTPGVQTVALTSNRDGSNNALNQWTMLTDSSFVWNARTTTTFRTQAKLIPSWLDNTDATRKAMLSFEVRGTGAGTIEALRLTTDGANAAIGFLGAAAVVRPSNTTDLRQGLIDLGLYSTGGASPLDLNGGTLTAGMVTTGASFTAKSSGELDANGSAGVSGQFLKSQGVGASALWADLPADTDSLAALADVSLSGVAQGDILYRGAATWNNLTHGVAGQVLTTNGLAANPSWTTLTPDLTNAVILAPGSDTRNLVRPTGDYPCLTLRPFLEAQVKPVMKVRNAADSGDYVTIDALGNLVLAQGSESISYVPASGSVLFDSAGQTTKINAGQLVLTLGSLGGGSVFPSGSLLDFQSNGRLGPTVGSPYNDQNFYITGRNATGSTILQGATSQSAPLLRLRGISSTSTIREQVDLTCTWADSTDASRKARAVLNVYDTAAREVLRLEASGSAPMIGFLGASAALRGAATSDLLQDIIAFGLKTGGGAVPLSLNAGQLANFVVPRSTQTSNYVVTSTDLVVNGNTSAGSFSLTLPTAVGADGRYYLLKNTGQAGNNLTIATTGGQTIDGGATAVLTDLTAVTVVSDNANWWIN